MNRAWMYANDILVRGFQLRSVSIESNFSTIVLQRDVLLHKVQVGHNQVFQGCLLFLFIQDVQQGGGAVGQAPNPLSFIALLASLFPGAAI